MVCSVPWKKSSNRRKRDTLVPYVLMQLQALQHFSSHKSWFCAGILPLSNILQPFILCPQFWAGKNLFLWAEFKEKKRSCNMPESSENKATLSCQLFFLSLGFVSWPQCCLSALGHPCGILVQAVGCHCGIPAVGIGISNFYCAWNTNLML